MTGERTGYFTFFRRLANGTLTNAGRIQSDGIDIKADNNSWPNVCDYNADGKKDLLVGEEGIYSLPCNVYVYLNAGTNQAPVFSDSIPVLFNGAPFSGWRTVPVLIDLDLDGKKDMVLGGWYSDVRFYTNTGTNANPVFNTFIYLVNPDSATFSNGNPPRINFTDWDGDGDLDMLTCDYYGSVFLRKNISGTDIAENSAKGQNPAGLRIIPNPVSDAAVLQFSLSQTGYVTIDIYSPDGRLVAEPYKGSANAGESRVTWIPDERLSNGVYFAVLKNGSDTRTEKLMIAR